MRPIEHVLGYARLGYAVLPLLPGEKRPHPRLVPHGLKEASRDPATLEAWWRSCPQAGAGILPAPEVLVLDFDDPEAWERLKEEHPTLLEAPRARTPRGGVHVYLRLPPEAVGRLSASVRAIPGVDLRGLGRSYLVAPPTTLPTGAYVWEVPLRRPEELPPVPAPLLARLLPPPPPPREVWTPVEGVSPKRLQALLQAYAAQVAHTPEGQRHNTLIRYAVAAGGLLPHGLDPREAEEALVAAAMSAGLPEAEARAAARWGLEVGASRPLALEPSLAPSGPRTYRARVYARMRRWA
ncbi:Bifunctional DNA primase/polymerase [Thermus thermophilus SG0.5JP17-16]|uniref:Bifunctional DNA primase/polymerase n=1 Tax=Thermus thermophilus (strain SG0.5JP17-16) TaxID=762633 RepID=F6DGT4_THETG|nr:bifunctional DNA primase/polymerase [Thermus thermophilus]AEG33442.1 Bifunctional DNA primase/polymerase [Thermus thermophilus SG0.5JP17-16]